MEERTCINCGTKAAPNDRFCPNCGQVLADQPGAAASGAFVPPPPPPPAPDAPVNTAATGGAFVPPPAPALSQDTPVSTSATGGAFIPPPPPPPSPDAPITSDATMMAFVPPPKAQGAFTPPPATAGNTAFIPPPESASPAPVRQDPVVPPPPSFRPPQDGTQMASITPPPLVAVTPSPNRPASVFSQQPNGTPPPAKQASVFSQQPSITPPPAKQAGVFSQPPTGTPSSPSPRPPYRPQRRFVPPTRSLPPSAPPPKKNNTGLIIGGCAALAVLLIGIVLIVVLVVLPVLNPIISQVTPVAKSTQVSKTTTSKTSSPATKVVDKTATPIKAATISAVNKAGIATGALLYSDDFSNSSSGWDTWENANSKVGYVSGKFVIEVFKVDSFFWANPGKDFSDFVLEVDSTKQAGPDDNGFGVIFRYVDKNNFYRFDISSDGYYDFGYYENDTWTSIIDWTETAAIKQGDATNTITILCKGSKLTFYINGTKITDVTDATLSSGDIGVWAGAVSEAGVKIAFDRLGVWKTK